MFAEFRESKGQTRLALVLNLLATARDAAGWFCRKPDNTNTMMPFDNRRASEAQYRCCGSALSLYSDNTRVSKPIDNVRCIALPVVASFVTTFTFPSSRTSVPFRLIPYHLPCLSPPRGSGHDHVVNSIDLRSPKSVTGSGSRSVLNTKLLTQ